MPIQLAAISKDLCDNAGATPSDIRLVEVPKNRRETRHLAINLYENRLLLRCPIWFDAGAGEYRPGRDGFAIDVIKLPEIIAALQQLEAEAKTRDILRDEAS
jgi:hypothetical protein